MAVKDPNEVAREHAAKLGRETFRYEVIDYWPAHVECGEPIRHRGVLSSPYRSCGCPGVDWTCGAEGWYVARRRE